MEPDQSKLGTGLALVGLALMTALVLVRAMVEHDAFPWWQTDPFVFSPPVVGLTPTKALVLNLAVVLCSSLTFIGFFIRGDRIAKPSAAMMVIGVGIIGYHGLINFESFLAGSNLLAIISVLYVASYAHKLVDAQKLIIATTLGFVVLLVAMGSYEVFVVHPLTIANYEQTRESFLSARGWTPGSFEALAYERRLNQPEPIAWFGLTNVFASFAGAGAAGLIVFGWSRRQSDRLWIIAFLAGLAGLGGLLMSGAKGGIGAFVLGLGLVIAAGLFPRRKFDGKAIILLCGVVVLGVVARGILGDRLGELSLLFRSQYMLGSVRMWFDHLLFGVGPGAFQENYAFFKPALSPEDVASAHSIPFDLLAMLGIGGIALVLVLISVLARINPRVDHVALESVITKRRLTQLTLLIIAAASVASIRFAAQAMDINLMVVQLLSIGLWMGIAVVNVQGNDNLRALRWAMFAGASVLAIHSMIEVTASWFVSGMLWALMIGSACTVSPERKDQDTRRDLKTLVVAIVLLLGGGAIGIRLSSVARWEAQLQIAAQPAIQVAGLRQQLNELEYAAIPSEHRAQIANELAAVLGRSVDDSIDSILNELNQIEFDRREIATEHLLEAVDIRPTHMQTRIAASEQLLWRASVLNMQDQQADAAMLWDQAIALIEAGVVDSTGSGGYLWLGNLHFARSQQFPDDLSVHQWLASAQENWNLAALRAPHNPQLALKLMDVAILLDESEQAAVWANRTLILHQESRLDPLRGLSESDLARVRLIVE
jgi:O-Antigen ligase